MKKVESQLMTSCNTPKKYSFALFIQFLMIQLAMHRGIWAVLKKIRWTNTILILPILPTWFETKTLNSHIIQKCVSSSDSFLKPNEIRISIFEIYKIKNISFHKILSEIIISAFWGYLIIIFLLLKNHLNIFFLIFWQNIHIYF